MILVVVTILVVVIHGDQHSYSQNAPPTRPSPSFAPGGGDDLGGDDSSPSFAPPTRPSYQKISKPIIKKPTFDHPHPQPPPLSQRLLPFNSPSLIGRASSGFALLPRRRLPTARLALTLGLAQPPRRRRMAHRSRSRSPSLNRRGDDEWITAHRSRSRSTRVLKGDWAAAASRDL
ncbi:hypothetical protein LR48_Vigan07g222600 [Vigna angularis]|uniref:Uncharacterized protein n=1 Tax=Phaseolus angularis TaxID=3914 RepID=A0A0L9V103_PHAAN|nr:hypothetical protein LR48_Vigan07g222600 [Vigna angularis]